MGIRLWASSMGLSMGLSRGLRRDTNRPDAVKRWPSDGLPKSFVIPSLLCCGLLLTSGGCTHRVLGDEPQDANGVFLGETAIDRATPSNHDRSPALTSQTTQTSPRPTPDPHLQALIQQVAPQGIENPPRGDVRIAVISDLNSAYGSTDYDPEVDTTLALLPYWQPDLVLCGGDMVAGQQLSLTDEEIAAMWQAFDDRVAQPLRRLGLPYGFTLGNHDASSALGSEGNFVFQRDRSAAAAYWQDPAHDPGLDFVDRHDFPFYYTFTLGDLFFLVWDSSSSRIPPEKLAWVEAALASDVAQNARLRFVIGHLPLYGVAVNRNRPGEVLDNADDLRHLLERYGVSTYISGHQHAYYPGKRGQLQLLQAGLLGSGPRALIDGHLPPWKAFTIVDITLNPTPDQPQPTRYTTYNLADWQVRPLEALPSFLLSHNGLVLRRDQDWEALSKDDRSHCLTTLGPNGCTD